MKKILILIIFIALASATFFYIKQRRSESDNVALGLRDAAWNVFQSYLNATKKHDLALLTKYSYQLSPTCKDPSKARDCEELMESAYLFGKEFKDTDFNHIAYDAKQVIIFSDYHSQLAGESPSRMREIIHFVRDNESIKILAFSPFQGAFIIRTPEMATSTIQARLTNLVIDTDGDTLSDDEENCIGQTVAADCVKTDPNKKDTDNDGFWDSTEAHFNKK